MVGNETNILCRLCLSEDGNLSCIFESKRMLGWTAADGIMELLQMQASVNDIYSQYICAECLEKLEDFKLFKQRCQSNKELCDRAYTTKRESEVETENTADDGENHCPSDMPFEKDPLDITEEEMNMKCLGIKDGIQIPKGKHPNDKIGSSDNFYILVNKDNGKPTTVLDNFNSKNLSASFKCTEPLPNSALPDNPPVHEFTLMRPQHLKPIVDSLEESREEDFQVSMPVKVEFDEDVDKGSFALNDSDETQHFLKDSDAEDEEMEEKDGKLSQGFMDPLVVLKETVTKDEDSSGEVNFMESLNSDNDGGDSALLQSDTNEDSNSFSAQDTVTNSETAEKEEDLSGNDSEEDYTKMAHSSSPQSSTSACIEEEMFPFGEMTFHCATCSQTFHTRHKLQIHECALVPRGYKCHLCGKSYSQNNRLKVHMLTHFQGNAFTCNVCKKTFAQRCSLKRHEIIHSEKKPYVCTTCGKDFVRKSQLFAHEISHGGERPFKCTHCDKSFVQNSHLTQHSLLHTGERPFQCIICQKGFTQSGHLRQHLRIHSGERPFKCKICGKGFIQNSHLKFHQYIHTGEKPFLCTDCQKRFAAKSDLKRHRLMFHKNKPS